METTRIEELESKELLTLEEFKELGHYRMESGNWPIEQALQQGITLGESKKRIEDVIYDHFHSRVCA